MATENQPAFRLIAALIAIGLVAGWGLTRLDPATPRMDPGPAGGPQLETLVPVAFGTYRARPVPLSEVVVDGAGADEVVFREYTPAQGPRVWMWLSYYRTQRTSSVHAPSACYAGLGWAVNEDTHTARTAEGEWPLRWLRVQREGDDRLVLYWYETGYGPVATEFQRNMLRLRGRVAGDTALIYVRLSTPTEGDPEAARARLLEVARWVRAPLKSSFDRPGPPEAVPPSDPDPS